MGITGEMLIDVTDGDTIKQVQLEEQIDELTLRINELENKNKMLTSEKLLMFVENKELKADIATMKRKNNLLKIANKFLRGRMDKYRLANKRWTTECHETHSCENPILYYNINRFFWGCFIGFIILLVLIVTFG